MKEEKAGTDSEEVKAEIKDMAAGGDTGGGEGEGVLVVTPWLRGEARHAWGLSHANHRNVLTLPWVQGALDSGYSPNAPLFSSPEVSYITLRWAFRRLLGHRIRSKGAGGGWRYTGGGGHGHGSPCSESPCPPSPNQLGLGI